MLAEDISPAEIRQIQSEKPGMRPRDLSDSIGISEAEYLCAWLDQGNRYITCRPEDIFPKLPEVGQLMALTRNACAVHEMIGVYQSFSPYRTTAECRGPGIRAHLTSKNWVYGFSVEKQRDDKRLCSFQFFDQSGEAVQKIHTRPTSDLKVWDRITQKLSREADPDEIRSQLRAHRVSKPLRQMSVSGLETMFDGCKSKLEYRRVSNDACEHMLTAAATSGLPLVCKINSSGCLQTHEGPVTKIMTMGPWVNVMDGSFHMHLRTDHLLGTYVIHRTNGAEIRTSLEAYDATGTRAIYFSNQDDDTAGTEKIWQKIIAELPKPQ